jgi:hypothetical protein
MNLFIASFNANVKSLICKLEIFVNSLILLAQSQLSKLGGCAKKINVY